MPRLLRRMTTVAAVATFGLVAWYAWSPWLAAWRYSHQLETVADGEADVLLRGAAELGGAGIPVLVAGLASPRESVFRAAEGVIDDQLEKWAMLPADEQQHRHELLAVRLAAEATRFGPSARQTAARFAARILRDGGHNGDSPTRTMIACDHVFRASALVGPPPAPSSELLARSDTPLAGAASPDDPTRRPPVDAANLAASPELLAGPAGGGLRPLPDDLVSSEASADGGSWIHAAHGEGTPNVPSTVANTGASTATGANDAVRDSTFAGVAGARGSQHAMQPARLDPQTDAASPPSNVARSDVPHDDATPPDQGEAELLAKRPAIELFADLRSSVASIRDPALEELTRRGFSPRESEVGRNLASPDPYERKRWVQLLPGLSGIDAKPWLLMMSDDENAGVRLATLTLMATSGDPETLRRAAEISSRDVDPSIQVLATEITARRTASETRRR